MREIALAVLIVSTLLPRVVGGVTYAWWLTVEFKPQHRKVAGLPIEEISPTWISASELSALPLPPEASNPGESLAEHGATFDRTLDLNQDGKLERALVGVYATASGTSGRFLLILPAGSPSAAPLALFESSGKAGFSALTPSGSTLTWSFCMECDSGCDVNLRSSPPRLDCHEVDD